MFFKHVPPGVTNTRAGGITPWRQAFSDEINDYGDVEYGDVGWRQPSEVVAGWSKLLMHSTALKP